MHTINPKTPSLHSLGLTFLFVGAGFALPFALFPESLMMELGRAPEVLNLFCLVAWMGLSHFYFAYRGHLMASRKMGRLPIYAGLFLVSLLALFGLREVIGYAIFSAIAWIYFISHLLRAETYFADQKDNSVFLFPLTAFTFFSFALLAPGSWVNSLSLFLGAAIALLPILNNPREKLKNEFFKPLYLIAMFLIGESLLWGTYRPYMTPEFRDGVYTVHVAMASFYHYFKSYAHMILRNQGSYREIVLVNLLVIGTGIAVQFLLSETLLIFLFGAQYFTVWVWLHQWMSDLFNWKIRRQI